MASMYIITGIAGMVLPKLIPEFITYGVKSVGFFAYSMIRPRREPTLKELQSEIIQLRSKLNQLDNTYKVSHSSSSLLEDGVEKEGDINDH